MIADLIDVGVIGRDVDYIFQKGIQMGICALLALITGLLYARFAARAAYGWGAKIREAEYERMQKYAFANLDHFETSSLITRMTTDVTVLQNAVNGGFRPLVRGPVMLIMGVALSFWMNAPAGADLCGVRTGAGDYSFFHSSEGSSHVRPASAGGRSAEQHRAGRVNGLSVQLRHLYGAAMKRKNSSVLIRS